MNRSCSAARGTPPVNGLWVWVGSGDFAARGIIHHMDRDTLLQLLLQAEQHLALSKRQIDNQYRVIAKLEGGGHDTTAAVHSPATVY